MTMPIGLKVWLLAAALAIGAASSASADRWVATWSAGSLPPAASGMSFNGFADQSVRQVVRTSLGGGRVRLRLTNVFGTAPLRLDKIAIARPTGPGAIDAATSTPVTFDGGRSVLIP